MRRLERPEAQSIATLKKWAEGVAVGDEGELAMTDLFDDDAKAARLYLRVVDHIEMCKPWLEKQLQKIREVDWEDCML